MSKTVKDLRFYPTFKLASYPATISWMLTDTQDTWVRDKDFVTQDTVSSIKISKFALVPFSSKYQRGLIAPEVDCITGGDP